MKKCSICSYLSFYKQHEPNLKKEHQVLNKFHAIIIRAVVLMKVRQVIIITWNIIIIPQLINTKAYTHANTSEAIEAAASEEAGFASLEILQVLFLT